LPRTDDQRTADAALSDAVAAAAHAYNLLPDGAYATEFVVVVEGVRYSDDPDEWEEFHGLLFREGSSRKSVGVGLLRIGEDLWLNGEQVDPGELP
jgi:hypothetical protein